MCSMCFLVLLPLMGKTRFGLLSPLLVTGNVARPCEVGWSESMWEPRCRMVKAMPPEVRRALVDTVSDLRSVFLLSFWPWLGPWL